MAEVLIRAPDGEQRIPLKSGTLSVGRERYNDVVINDPKASRKHAQIEKIGEQWIITDLGSSNGTFLRGERISQVIIHEMDIFSIGAVQMVFSGVEEKVADDLMPTTMASAEVLQAKMDAMAQARSAPAQAPAAAAVTLPVPAAPVTVAPEPAPAPKPLTEAAKKITDAMDGEVAEMGTVAIMADQAAIAQSAPPPPTITPGLSNPFSSTAPKNAGSGGSMSNEAPPAAPPADPAAPVIPAPPGPPGRSAAEQLKFPAIGLIAAGALGLLSQFITLLLRFGLFALPASLSRMSGGGVIGGLGFAFGIVIAVIGITVNLFVIFGAFKMMSLKSYPLAVAAAIVAIIPFFSSCPCCFVGMGFGIWAIIVLIKPDVKAAFK